MLSSSRRAAAIPLPIIPQVAAWIREHPGTLSLGQGVAGYGPPPEAWSELRRLADEPLLHRYQPVTGLPELTAALRADLERRSRIPRQDPRGLMVTAGANAAFLQAMLAILDVDDEVILPVPCYFNHEMAIGMAGGRAVLVPSDDRYIPDPDAIARAITPRTRAVVTVSPNNPSGAVFPEPILRAIHELCVRRGLFHISDETYERFVHGGARHVSPGAFPGADQHTISLFSFSKAYGLASWRVGCVLFPPALQEDMVKIQDTNLICPPVASQLAALGCLRAGDDWVSARIREVGETRDRVLARLKDLGDQARFGASDGAFYVLLAVASRESPLEVTRRLIAEHRVAVIPGSAFGFTQGCLLRVAYGALDPRTADEGVGRLVEGLRGMVV